jgi:hypothetical protein
MYFCFANVDCEEYGIKMSNLKLKNKISLEGENSDRSLYGPRI